MQMSYTLLCVSLCVLSTQLLRTHGMDLMSLEKRGWTLNSAGYLLGPYAHRTLTVRHGTAVGKRNRWDENPDLSTHQPSYRSLTDEQYVQSLLEHLMYLRMKENEMNEDGKNSVMT